MSSYFYAKPDKVCLLLSLNPINDQPQTRATGGVSHCVSHLLFLQWRRHPIPVACALVCHENCNLNHSFPERLARVNWVKWPTEAPRDETCDDQDRICLVSVFAHLKPVGSSPS